VAEIVRCQFPEEDWPWEIYMEIAKLGRLVPRAAIELARELETEVLVSESPEHSLWEHLEQVRRARDVDGLGLTPLDVRYLAILEGEDKPVGEQTILNMLGNADRDRITDEIEPFLKRLGFIRFGPRGREITSQGKEHLHATRGGVH
jgi:Holliday junction resolvasome RuvABC ATP-dependent DNA helicase subunit